ncbi:MAG: hypothetical protein LBB74_08580 [Chitinispirillales bacterium]|jgi:hypothetical protein|nr:hypothetical protein [Chitinispirillales bacterium]
MDDDGISPIIKLILFLLFLGGGIMLDAIKKNKMKREEDELEREENPPAAMNTRQSNNTGIKTRPNAAKKTAKQKVAQTEDSEWLMSLADRKRREAAKAAEKSPVFENDTTIDEQFESPTHFTLSAQQARDGFVLAEILGPPVSLK